MTFLGYVSPSVSATNHVYNIFAIPGGVWRYVREGRMAWPITWIVIMGTLPGVALGAFIRIRYLPDPRNFKLFAGFVLLFIGGHLLKNILEKSESINRQSVEEKFQNLVKIYRRQHQRNKTPLPKIKMLGFNVKKLVIEFYGEEFSISVFSIFLISAVIGIIGGIYGIGGGAIMAPILVSFFKLPVYIIAGAALMGTFVTSIFGVLFFQLFSWFYPAVMIAPDYLLGMFFGIGGLIGMYLGARIQKFMPASVIKLVLVFCILILAVKYIFRL
jgi:uncharacterized membrane protein YfcA